MAFIEGSGRAAERSCSERCSTFFHSKCFAVALLIVSLALFGTGMGIGGAALFGGALKFAATLGTAGGMGIFIPCTVLLAVGVIVSVVLLVKRMSCSPVSLFSAFDSEAVFEAIERDDIEQVKQLVNEQNVNTFDKHGAYTPLQKAAILGRLEIVKFLVAKGANANVFTASSRTTALHLAMWQKHYDIMEYLLKYGGADPNYQMRGHITTIHDAVKWSDLKAVELLFKYQADPNIPATLDAGMGTCLDLIGWTSEVTTITPMMQLLLDHGAKTCQQLNAEKKKS